MSGDDPLKVKDWSAYEKSMLDVLREERRSKLAVVPSEPLADAVATAQTGQCPEPGVEPSAQSPAATAREPVSLPSADEREGEVAPSADAAQPSVDAPPPVWQEEPAPGLGDAASAAASIPAGESAPEQIATTALPDDANLAAPAIPGGQFAPRAVSHRRIALVVVSAVVAMAGAVTAIVYLQRDAASPPGTAAVQDGRVEKNSSLAPNPSGQSAGDPRTAGHEVAADRVRLRIAPEPGAAVVVTLRRGAPVRVNEQAAGSEWCRVQAAEHAGWLRCEFLRQRSVAGSMERAK